MALALKMKKAVRAAKEPLLSAGLRITLRTDGSTLVALQLPPGSKIYGVPLGSSIVAYDWGALSRTLKTAGFDLNGLAWILSHYLLRKSKSMHLSKTSVSQSIRPITTTFKSRSSTQSRSISHQRR